MSATPLDVLRALADVVDPDQGKDIVRLGMVKNLHVAGERISFTVLLKNPGSSFAGTVKERAERAVQDALGTGLKVSVDLDNEMIGLAVDEPGKTGQSGQPAGVRNFVAVASGKGGVGKSTVAANLAVALAQQGFDVGLVDTDIYGPSIPTMFGVGGEKPRVNQERKIVPLERHGVRLLSMGFLVDPEKAVIWRGPMVSSAVKQFLGDTDWGELDYLILDLPPGTGDIQLTIVQTIALSGAVIVSTPQEVALADARKGVAMFENVNVPVLGIVENMSFFSPPDLPDRKYYLFGQGGARRLAHALDVAFLGEVPIEQVVRETSDEGQPVVVAAPESLSARAFQEIARHVSEQVSLRNAIASSSGPVEILYR
jgi:ATP-binding protein involved in chromosome partitioning